MAMISDVTCIRAVRRPRRFSRNDAPDASYALLYFLNVLKRMVDNSMPKYNSVNDGYDSKFKSYTKYLKNRLLDMLANYMIYMNGPRQSLFDHK
jgi:chitinase